MEFGTTDSNIAFMSQIEFGIKLSGGMNYMVYDELQVYAEFDVSVEQEEIFGNLNELKVSKGGSDPNRDAPVWNDIDVSAAEYSAFWDWVDQKSDSVFRWFNQNMF